ncbi:MAG: hypothetical protein ABI477_04920 [Chryseolinea sp.]
MIRFKLSTSLENVRPEIEYVLRVWAKNQGLEISFGDDFDNGISIGHDDESHLKISADFVNTPTAFARSSLHAGKVYIIENAFKLLNCVQEYCHTDVDDLGRFKFRNSYQYQLKNHTENLVQKLFEHLSTQVGVTPVSQKTKFFLTHDIDLVNGAILEDGFYVLKRGRVDLFLKMLFNVAMCKPDWLNIDKIMKLESEYDCRSTFFWIVNKGKINQRERNADYSFNASKIQDQFKEVTRNKFENGIHKSISSESFADEFKKFGTTPFSNRYHYLKFQLPDAFHDIDAAGLQLDASLGFAEEIGFRNSYGLPFNPYNIKEQSPFAFIEAPLHVMDRTFFQYKKSSTEEAEKDILGFFERNKTNCLLSVLWHNNFFTNYKFKGYLDIYKRILAYIMDNKFETINSHDIVKNYSITHEH